MGTRRFLWWLVGDRAWGDSVLDLRERVCVVCCAFLCVCVLLGVFVCL